jgi:aspartate kinase
MKVLKFGGSSLADAKQFEKVKNIILADENRKYVVVSAPGKGIRNNHKVTDLFLMCYQLASHGLNINEVFRNVEDTYRSIVKDLNLDIDVDIILRDIYSKIQAGASLDYTISRGEYINAILMSAYLGRNFVDSKEVIFFENDRIDEEKTERKIKEVLQDKEYSVIPGFYGSDQDGNIKTFSRGGSDVTGSLIANGLIADEYENRTDVSGFLVADPRIVKGSKTIENITYRELRELSYMGAPVLHQDAIFPVKKHKIPINIKNTNEPENKGTRIVEDYEDKIDHNITGISGKKGFTVITVEKTFMNADLGFFRKICSVFETNEISIEHMPSSIDSVSIIVPSDQIAGKLQKVLEEIKIYTSPDAVTIEDKISLIAIVGKGMVKKKGISSKIFTALAKENINIKMINQGSSELNIIIGVDEKDFEKSIKAIYDSFI